jgi:hypothetical protein
VKLEAGKIHIMGFDRRFESSKNQLKFLNVFILYPSAAAGLIKPLQAAVLG